MIRYNIDSGKVLSKSYLDGHFCRREKPPILEIDLSEIDLPSRKTIAVSIKIPIKEFFRRWRQTKKAKRR